MKNKPIISFADISIKSEHIHAVGGVQKTTLTQKTKKLHATVWFDILYGTTVETGKVLRLSANISTPTISDIEILYNFRTIKTYLEFLLNDTEIVGINKQFQNLNILVGYLDINSTLTQGILNGDVKLSLTKLTDSELFESDIYPLI